MDWEWPEISSLSASIICLLLSMVSVWFLAAFIALSVYAVILERERRLGSILVLCAATVVLASGCGHMSAINTEREARNAYAVATQLENEILGDQGPRAMARATRTGNRLAREAIREGDLEGAENILDQQGEIIEDMLQRSQVWEQGAGSMVDSTGQTIQSAEQTVDQTDLLAQVGLGGVGDVLGGGAIGTLLGGGMVGLAMRGRRKRRKDPLYLKPRRGNRMDEDDPRMTQEQYNEANTYSRP